LRHILYLCQSVLNILFSNSINTFSDSNCKSLLQLWYDSV